MKAVKRLFPVAAVLLELVVRVNQPGFRPAQDQRQDALERSLVRHSNAHPAPWLEHAMELPHDFHRVEVEVFHRFPAQNGIKTTVAETQRVPGGMGWAEHVEQIDELRGNFVFLIERFERVNRRVISLKDRVGTRMGPQ